MITLNCEAVMLAEAAAEDYEFYYNLKCEPNSVYWSGYSSEPDYEKLKAWYYNILSDSTKMNMIIRYNGEPAGYINFKVYNYTVCDDFSITVSERFCGRGVATCAIRKLIDFLRKEYTDCKIFNSYIREDNIASQKAHRNNGFELSGEYEDKLFQPDNRVLRLQKWIKDISI